MAPRSSVASREREPLNPSRKPTIATVDQLRALRHGLKALRQARATLGAGGVTVPTELGDFESRLTRLAVAVEVRCAVCRQVHPVVVHVGDPTESEPAAVLCERCDSEAMDSLQRPTGAATNQQETKPMPAAETEANTSSGR